MESNARFVKWSDGSTQLMIGKNVALDVIERPVDEHHVVFAKLGSGVIECQARVQDRVRLQPTSETRRAFMKHQNSIKAQQAKQKEIKQVTLRKRNEGHEEEDKLKAMRLRQRREARQAARRQREEKGLTSAFLVGGSARRPHKPTQHTHAPSLLACGLPTPMWPLPSAERPVCVCCAQQEEDDDDDISSSDEELTAQRNRKLQAAKSDPFIDDESSASESDIDMSDEDGPAPEAGAAAAAAPQEEPAAEAKPRKRARVASDSEDEDD